MGSGDDEKDLLTPTLQRVNGRVVFQYLLTPHIAHALSGSQVRSNTVPRKT